jgi:hypothetical protein
MAREQRKGLQVIEEVVVKVIVKVLRCRLALSL